MKIQKLLAVGLALLAFSCSKDEEPSLKDQKLSLSGEEQVIVAPSALLTSQDENAQTTSSYIALANGLSSYFSYFNIPSGASKSKTKITASNGRVASTGDFYVYTWTDASTGYSIAYQISEESDSYVFEFFFMMPGSSDWLKYMHMEEKKDRSSGSMKVYDIFNSDASVVILECNWSRAGNIFNFTMNMFGDGKIVLTYNESTKAGSVEFYSSDVIYYSSTWDAAGNGTWAYYDEEGNVADSGTWTI